MVKTILKAAFMAVLTLSAAVVVFGQNTTAPEPSVDAQIKAALAEQEKLKQLNRILTDNSKIREANRRLQKGLPAAPKREETATNEEKPASGETPSTGESKAAESTVKDPAPESGDEDAKTVTVVTPVVLETPARSRDKTVEVKQSETAPKKVSQVDFGSSAKDKPVPESKPKGFDPPSVPTDLPDEDASLAELDKNQAWRECSKVVKGAKLQTSNSMNLCLLAYDLLTNTNFEIDTGSNGTTLTKAISGRLTEEKLTNDIQKTLLEAEGERISKQIGSESRNSGTTSLVTRAAIPAIFNFAVENGAAESSTNGTTVNFRFNPVGLTEMLMDGTTANIDVFGTSDSLVKQLRRMAFGLSYDTARGVDIPMFTGSRDQFSGFSFSYGFLDKRKPTSELVHRKTFAFLNNFTADYHDKAVSTFETLYDDDDSTVAKFVVEVVNKALKEKAPAISGETNKEKKITMLYEVLQTAFAKAPVDEIKKNATINDALKIFTESLAQYQRDEDDFRRRLRRAQLLTFDYNYNRSFTANDVSNLKMIYEKGWGNGMDISFNGAFSMFHSTLFRVPLTTGTTPPTARPRRFRDFSFSTQLDIPLTGLSSSLSESMLSFAAKYQRMMTDSVILFDGTVVNNIKGDIFIAQAKTRLPIISGFSLPLSFTYANRPELVKEKKSRGNFGFTFDLTQLLEKFNPFKSLIDASRQQ